MIARTPHRLFACLWFIWATLTIYLFLLGPTIDWWILWSAMFLVIELSGVVWKSGFRDTLSEITTWLQRHLSKHRSFARGWNAAILAFAFICARMGVYPLGNRADAFVISVLVTIWLYDHWVSPDLHG